MSWPIDIMPWAPLKAEDKREFRDVCVYVRLAVGLMSMARSRSLEEPESQNRAS